MNKDKDNEQIEHVFKLLNFTTKKNTPTKMKEESSEKDKNPTEAKEQLIEKDQKPIETKQDLTQIDNKESIKFDEGKLDFHLVPPLAFQEVVKVLTSGAKKYEPENWRKSLTQTRLFSAAMRHSFQWLSGETYDKETGIHHLAHACCNFLFIIEKSILKNQFDDRYYNSNYKE